MVQSSRPFCTPAGCLHLGAAGSVLLGGAGEVGDLFWDRMCPDSISCSSMLSVGPWDLLVWPVCSPPSPPPSFKWESWCFLLSQDFWQVFPNRAARCFWHRPRSQQAENILMFLVKSRRQSSWSCVQFHGSLPHCFLGPATCKAPGERLRIRSDPESLQFQWSASN